MMETSRRSFLKTLGLFTAGLAIMPEEPIRRLWALGAVEQTASGITVFKQRFLIQISNELLRDSAPVAEEIVKRLGAKRLKTSPDHVRLHLLGSQPANAFTFDQTWFEVGVA